MSQQQNKSIKNTENNKKYYDTVEYLETSPILYLTHSDNLHTTHITISRHILSFYLSKGSPAPHSLTCTHTRSPPEGPLTAHWFIRALARHTHLNTCVLTYASVASQTTAFVQVNPWKWLGDSGCVCSADCLYLQRCQHMFLKDSSKNCWGLLPQDLILHPGYSFVVILGVIHSNSCSSTQKLRSSWQLCGH